MNPGPTPGDEFSDGSIGSGRLQQLHQTLPRRERLYPRAIRIGNCDLLHAEYFTAERIQSFDRIQRNADVGDSGSLWGWILH